MSANNKFLTKFINVKNFKLEPSKAINILKLPINLINLKIPIRDIYLKLNCPSGTKCGLYNVKIYGINEYNSYKFTQELDLITARLQEEIQEEELNNDGNSYEETEFIENNGEILGDDELYW